MGELEKLATKYGTDKVGKHNYCPEYERLFGKRRNEIKKVLEIGVGEGAGIKMFRDYFSNAQIYGAEIDDNRIFKEDRIEVFKCDQTNLNDLTNLACDIGTDIDIVVDDGSHIPEHQVFTCLVLMYVLKKGVTYIIEDVADPSIKEELKKYDVEVIKCGKRYDDRLLIVRHK